MPLEWGNVPDFARLALERYCVAGTGDPADGRDADNG